MNSSPALSQHDFFTRFAWLSSANCAYFQGVLDRTVPPNRREHIKGASDYLSYWQRKYRVAASHLAALMKARESLPTDDAEIERAQEAETKRRGAFRSVMRPVESFPSSSLEQLGTLADQVRGLASLNDPDAGSHRARRGGGGVGRVDGDARNLTETFMICIASGPRAVRCSTFVL
jgi:hypothetical protein